MDASDYVRRQVGHVWHLSAVVLDGLTDDQVAWGPPATANSIGVILIHVLADDDLFIQTLLQGRPRLWEAARWGERFGLTTPPVNEDGWEAVRRASLAAAPVVAYARAVGAAADAYLAELTATELDRPVVLDGIVQPVADILAALVAHTLLHLGEVAAIKGLHGRRGLPF